MRLSEGYLRAESIGEAIDALRAGAENSIVLAGGTVVASLVNQKLLAPSLIVDISRIKDLRRIERRSGGGLLIGALATHDDVLRSPEIREECPLLTEIADEISCARLRNRGTVGGSLCSVGQQGDMAVGLLALGAKIKIRGPLGNRAVPIEEFYSDGFSTVLKPDELLVDVEVSPLPPGAGWAFAKVGPRKAMDYTLVSVAVTLTRNPSDGAIRTTRIGINGAAQTAMRPRETESELVGRQSDKLDWDRITGVLDGEISPPGDLIFSEEYKRHVCSVTVRRCVERALSRTKERGKEG